MGILANSIRRGVARTLSTASSSSDWFRTWIHETPTHSGVPVDPNTALNYSAVWAATCFYTAKIATVPHLLYRRLANGDRERADKDPLYRLLADEPNPEQDSCMYWTIQVPCLLNWGNCYAEIQRDWSGKVVALWPIHASRVRVLRDTDTRQIRYAVSSDTGTGAKVTLESRDVLHIAGWLSNDGITGLGVIDHAKESIGLGIATERFGAAFFGNGATPGGVLSHPGGKLSPQAEKNIVEAWNRTHQGPASYGKVALLREGVTYTAIGIPPEQAQFLGTRQFNIAEIARWYNLPPHVLRDLTRSTNNNIESEALSIVKDSIQPWCVRIERAYQRQIIHPQLGVAIPGADSDDLYSEFLLDSLLRADMKTRTDALAKQFLTGLLTIDEWRALENQNSTGIPAGKKHFVPVNMTTLDSFNEDKPPAPPAPVIPPPEEPEDDSDPEEDGDGEGDMSDEDAQGNLSVIVADTVDRLRRVQANEIRRAAKNHRTFLARLDAFAGSHLATVTAALAPIATTWAELTGSQADPWDIAKATAGDIVADFHNVTLEIAEATPAGLAGRASEVLDRYLTEPIPRLKTEV